MNPTPRRTTTVRTFRAPDVRTALQQVKVALGPDAVILSNREISGGVFRKAEVEVTAALSHEDAELTPPTSDARPLTSATPLASRAGTSSAALALELESLRSVVVELQREMREDREIARLEHPHRIPPQALKLVHRLVDSGMEAELASEFVRQAVKVTPRGGLLAWTDEVRRLLSDQLIPARAPWQPDRRRVVALVGPTGVGKTTTVAKIAARAVMESRLKVALVTLDTYRIGAIEQLSRYGELLRVPTFVARNREELVNAIHGAREADLVLVDTAGRSLHEAVAKQAELLRSVPDIQLYLTLSAASGGRELRAAVDRYAALKPERLVITKMDEAVGPGAVLAATTRLMRPIACVTYGQSVPEDLARWSTSDWVTRLLDTPQHPSDERHLGEA